MNCREFINEFEERGALSGVAQVHLNDCPGCRKTTIVQTHIWKAIEGLPTVDAPANFDFRVKARIADGKPTADFQPKLLPVLRYVLPFSAIVLVLGLLAFNTNIFFGGDTAPEVATLAPSTPIAAENPPTVFPSPELPTVSSNVSQSFTNEDFAVTTADRNTRLPSARPEPQFAAAKTTRKSSPAPRRESTREILSGGGSQDRTFTETKVLTPVGIPSRPSEIKPNVGNAPVARSEDIWSFVGIEIASANGIQTIKAVTPNSLAARADVRVGDVVEAVNGVKLSAQPLNAEVVEIKTLTILRGTERLEIGFKN